MHPAMAFVPTVLYVIALVLGIAGVAIPGGDPGLSPLGQWILLLPLGLQSLWSFLGHVFQAEPVARSIGWATSPFQYEVGVANLGIGLASIAAVFLGAPAGWAMFLMAAAFLGGAAIGHVREMREKRNFAINNCGPVFWNDILAPLTLLVSLLL